jgi:hypothetical protein
VTAVDLDEPSLCVADDRLGVYGCEVDLQLLNATEVSRRFAARQFDFIVFVACIEHMLHDERIQAMRSTWEMLAPGGLWCLADTPNRLWRFDLHTSWLPFTTGCPTDLALAYSRYSSREPFASSYATAMPDAATPGAAANGAMESFLRHGRGVSYHEFALALGHVETLDVVSSLPIWLRERSPLRVRQLARRIKDRWQVLPHAVRRRTAHPSGLPRAEPRADYSQRCTQARGGYGSLERATSTAHMTCRPRGCGAPAGSQPTTTTRRHLSSRQG